MKIIIEDCDHPYDKLKVETDVADANNTPTDQPSFVLICQSCGKLIGADCCF